MKNILLPAILLLSSLFSILPAQRQTFKQIDEIFAEFTRQDKTYPLGRPGCALAVVRNGEIFYKQGYGMADLEHGIPITPQSVFYAGSVSKQFVATSILLLEEQGKLSLDDDVRRYVPELPDYGATITLRHLIHHTSGLRDYLDLWVLSGRNYLDHMPDEAVLDMISRQKALNFAPGEAYSYSNSGYFLLMTIVERISGQSFKDFARTHILDPLGMENSHFHDDLHHLIPNRAWGYHLTKDSQVEQLIMRFDLVGSGGLYTTVEDLYKWDQNFYDNQLGKGRPSLIDTLQRDGILNNGESAGYAFAMRNGSYRGLPTVSHSGSMGGYRAYYLRFPEQQFSVIILGNFSNFTPVAYAERVADILLDHQLAPLPPAKSNSVSMSLFEPTFTTAELQGASGVYYSSELDARARITGRDGELFLRVGYGESIPLKVWIKRGEGFGIRFAETKGKKIGAFLLNAGQIQNIRFERME
jgi:CubicO group peptidase (beta-lactamase class C family)